MLSDDNRGTFIVQKNVLFCERFFVLRRQAPDGRIVSVFCGSGFCGDLLLFFFFGKSRKKIAVIRGVPVTSLKNLCRNLVSIFFFVKESFPFYNILEGEFSRNCYKIETQVCRKLKMCRFFIETLSAS